jgi:3',5'-cyclic AMP phosphodiesterase CpdA
MRVLVHLSDIHFGRINSEVVQPLVAAVWEHRPQVVVVSGDLTQRARTAEFKQARTFLDALPQPQIVVPGNHDIPLHNLFRRFYRPLKKYRRFITDDLAPFYQDDEIIVAGVNTARSLTMKGGRINEDQIDRVGQRFCAIPETVTKVLVTHHPFDGARIHRRDIVGRAGEAMDILASCGADLLLSGHLHVGQTTSTALRYQTGAKSALVVQAGTATSSRGRGEANSFNLLLVEPQSVVIERHEWRPDEGRFVPAHREAFRRTELDWQPVIAEARTQ